MTNKPRLDEQAEGRTEFGMNKPGNKDCVYHSANGTL